MAQINGVDSNLTNLSIDASKTEGKKELGQQDFLELLVAQIKNQDPLDPQTNGEFLSQLAQFSSADGISKMQQSLDTLSNSLQSNQALQASALVGRKVLVPGDSGFLSSSAGLKAAVDLPVSASNLRASIYSSSGELVNSIELGAKPSGMVNFEWDGLKSNGQRAQEGMYTIKVEGLSEGKNKAFGTMIAANVDSVTLGQNGDELKLNVAGIGQIPLSQVKQISV
jgi:flagellar basal-body rod modification protein FlgD